MRFKYFSFSCVVVLFLSWSSSQCEATHLRILRKTFPQEIVNYMNLVVKESDLLNERMLRIHNATVNESDSKFIFPYELVQIQLVTLQTRMEKLVLKLTEAEATTAIMAATLPDIEGVFQIINDLQAQMIAYQKALGLKDSDQWMEAQGEKEKGKTSFFRSTAFIVVATILGVLILGWLVGYWVLRLRNTKATQARQNRSDSHQALFRRFSSTGFVIDSTSPINDQDVSGLTPRSHVPRRTVRDF